ncbi:hypothetical protein J7W19_28115 [Streptomyces mobaraensis NBRC 13819 = DSM 40847]|uniref:Uncharacterized protein n=2 Tax=Streptomyces mobaraensis TaxID=35621 RepID=A0A5N5WA33_STRMB|nr:hypothetical protein [Streptomyces mobaraensis]EME96313.1 hypothetical protein H340_32125 [Streptomyces mobaraensis NBRC 13819 = DSM 40847]KAB7847314.1 hypothetical protein FRZ00_11470 [Streptomyces mobaraensis]QTT76729.1 hypothetical protein J7W19_28115 [Streptomyces mobaraensis NBRC 13819 = DSM 40847]
MLPEITEHECTGCGKAVKGIFGRWACPDCKTSSPYREPPGAYAAELRNGVAPRRDPLRHHVCGEVACVCPRLSRRGR